MTGPEAVDIRAMKAELLEAIRDEVGHELQSLREEMVPAMRLAAVFARLGEAVADILHVIKWGTGVGASVVAIIAGLRVLGII